MVNFFSLAFIAFNTFQCVWSHRHVRIVGGIKTAIGEAPFMVALEYFHVQICGGSILNEHWVITAAHCFEDNFSVKDGMIRAGSGYIERGGVLYSLELVERHTFWKKNSNDFDIAVIKVHTPFTFSPIIQPIAIARGAVPGSVCSVYGFGETQEKGDISYYLQRAPVEIISNEDCIKNLKIPRKELTPRMLCAGNLIEKRDACMFDSGGPLVLDGKLLAIVSWGIGCARMNKPGVYTYLPSLERWIKAATAETGFAQSSTFSRYNTLESITMTSVVTLAFVVILAILSVQPLPYFEHEYSAEYLKANPHVALQVGVRLPGDILLFSKKIYRDPIRNAVQVQDVIYKGFKTNITYILAWEPAFTNSSARIISGGLQKSNATISLMSGRSNALNYTLNIYGK